MDAFVIHPYGDNSSQSPSTAHPSTTTIGIADYGKLVALLGAAFDGTAQPGSELPIFYGEFGVESDIPSGKASLYTGAEPAVTRPVSETTQAAFYEQALALAFCQPTVDGVLLFLSRDERARPGWQSGIHYTDGTPKTSKPRVTESLDRTTGGSITRCPGVELPVRTSYLRFGTRSAAKRGVFRVSFRCDLDCRYWVRLENAATHSTKLARKGSAEVGELVQADLGTRRLKAGTYRYTIRLIHPVNPAPATVRQAAPGFPSALVAVLHAPDADDDVRTRADHDDERERVATRRQPVADHQPDRHHRENDGCVEQLPIPVGPRLEVAATLPPDEKQEECDRQEERDLQDSADRRDDGLEREHDDDERDQRDDAEPARQRRDAIPETSHDPDMKARTASAPATSVVTANHSSRLGPTPGA